MLGHLPPISPEQQTQSSVVWPLPSTWPPGHLVTWPPGHLVSWHLPHTWPPGYPHPPGHLAHDTFLATCPLPGNPPDDLLGLLQPAAAEEPARRLRHKPVQTQQGWQGGGSTRDIVWTKLQNSAKLSHKECSLNMGIAQIGQGGWSGGTSRC